jgi:crotonobetainyl-CoA:carnitine CoA-transferase CaiB-like acyl-CoA transferase
MGDDSWISIVARDDSDWRALSNLVPALSAMTGLDFNARAAREAEIDAVLARWCADQDAWKLERLLLQSGIPAAALASSTDLVANTHLRERGFWDDHAGGVLPGLPWRASFGRAIGPAPAVGADTEAVLQEVRRRAIG